MFRIQSALRGMALTFVLLCVSPAFAILPGNGAQTGGTTGQGTVGQGGTTGTVVIPETSSLLMVGMAAAAGVGYYWRRLLRRS